MKFDLSHKQCDIKGGWKGQDENIRGLEQLVNNFCSCFKKLSGVLVLGELIGSG